MSTKSGNTLLLISAFCVVLALVTTQPVAACTATCPHGDCSGNKSCTCDANGYPNCSDYPPAEEVLVEYGAYLAKWDLPGLNRVAEAADRMLQSLRTKDYDGYFLALLDHDKAVEDLSPKEQRIRAQWSPSFELMPQER